MEGQIALVIATAALVMVSAKESFLGRLGGGPNIGREGQVS